MNFTSCIVKRCKNRAYPGTTVRFHPLPKDPARRREWLSNLNTKIFQDVSWEECALVCGDHFKQEHYDECNRLLEDAVPIKTALPSRTSAPCYKWSNVTPSAESHYSIKKENTNQLSIETLSTNETVSLTENKPPCDATCDVGITEVNIDQPKIEILKNEADSPTEDNWPLKIINQANRPYILLRKFPKEATSESDVSDVEVANEPDESESEASENMEEIETVIEIEDDEDVPETIRVIIDDWEGPRNPMVTSRVAAADDVMLSDGDFEVPEIIKACRVCLAMDCRMFRLQSRIHLQMYTDTTGIPMSTDDAFPQLLCWECAGRVRAAAGLRARAHAARHALMGILYDHGKITMNSVRSINRREHKLTSQLSEKYIKPNEYITFNEVRLKDISEIISHKNDKESVEENTNVDNIDPEERPVCLFDEIDLIPDRTLVDIDADMTENYTDVYTNDVTNDIQVGLNANYVKENDAVGDDDENEKNGDEPTEGLWVGRLTRHFKWNNVLEYMEYFTITAITKEEELEIQMDRNNKNNAGYKCDICHRGYLAQSVYERHVLQHTEKYGKFECEICKIRKLNPRAVRTHVRRCHGKKYSCNECPYVTIDAAMAKRHYTQHSYNNFECSHCSKKFSSKVRLLCHLRGTHLCAIPCEICGNTFPTSEGKCRHRVLVHPGDNDKTPLEGPYCAVCDVTFASRAAHDTHLTKSSRHNDHVTYASQRVPEYFKDFTITKLTKEEEIAEMEMRKEKSAPYKCGVCHRGYLQQSCYEEHILKHTDKYGTVECEICKIRMRTQKELRSHMRRHKKRYSCKKCAFVTSNVCIAKYHHIHHADVKYKCPHCSQEFSRITSYHGHLRTSHPCEFACEYCGHTYRSEKGKSFHQYMTHRFDKDETPLEGPHCAVCDVTFASRAAHDTHLTKSSRHNNDKTCKISNNYLRQQSQYISSRKKKQPHDYTATIYLSVTCEQCGKTFSSVWMYVHHFKNEHPGQTRAQYVSGIQTPFICEHCGKVYQSLTSLEDHMTLHTGEYFECHDCGKRFGMKSRLALHLNIHNEKRRKYKCTVCPKLFMTPSSRHKHIKACHANVKPYECEACGIRFVVPSLLRAHIDHVHNKVPWPKRNRRPRH